jgi:hypothetical protein
MYCQILEKGREMGGERCRYYKRYHGKKSVVPNFLKFFPTGLTEFYVMRPARVK